MLYSFAIIFCIQLTTLECNNEEVTLHGSNRSSIHLMIRHYIHDYLEANPGYRPLSVLPVPINN